ncbi:MAG: NAD(+) synthase [Leptospiraceae bacterium]
MRIRISTASVNQTPLDWSGNRKRILQAAEEAMKSGPEVILFPELCISGYGCEDAFHMPEMWQSSLDSLDLLCEKLGGIAGSVPVIVGLPYMHQGLLYNVAAVIHSGSVAAIVPKQHLAGDGIHYEPRWFHPHKSGPDQTGPNGIPFGPTIFDTGRLRFLIEICEDSWVDNRPASQHAGSSFDLILSPTASHFAIGKQRIRRQIALESSRAFHCTYVSVNLLGNEAGRAIYDGQTLACHSGELLLESTAFSFKPYTVHNIEFNPIMNRSKRVQTHSFRESISIPPGSMLESATVRLETHFKKEFGFRLPGEEKGPARAGFSHNDSRNEDNPDGSARSSSGDSGTSVRQGAEPLTDSQDTVGASNSSQYLGRRHGNPYLEFLYATTLALFDYLRKSHSRGFALSLSGGADSGACAVLVERMVRTGITDLGLKGFLQAIDREDLLEEPDIRGETSSGTIEPLLKHLLFTVYQGTDQSSTTTSQAARLLAEALGSNHQQVQIQSIVDNYIGIYEQAYERKLEWQSDDIVLQNIQARARSPFVWMLANSTGSLLIATGNRSEGAVGYCTMDGDTSGGIAPIAGIDKNFLRAWLLFMEHTGDSYGPIPALRAINEQQPTAELRPGQQHQTDEDDLMAYDLLNRIQKLAVRDRQGPAQILEELLKDQRLPVMEKTISNSQSKSSALQQENDPALNSLKVPVSPISGSNPQLPGETRFRPFSGDYSRSELIQAIRKYFTLWSRNQWKRERIAVSFHLDDENIDPRTYFRFPILSSGFLEELAALE